MSAHKLAIEPVDPVINNPGDAVQQLGYALENAVCLFKVIEEAMFVDLCPGNDEASKIHATLMLGVETLRQYARTAHTIADTMEAAR